MMQGRWTGKETKFCSNILISHFFCLRRPYLCHLKVWKEIKHFEVCLNRKKTVKMGMKTKEATGLGKIYLNCI